MAETEQKIEPYTGLHAQNNYQSKLINNLVGHI